MIRMLMIMGLHTKVSDAHSTVSDTVCVCYRYRGGPDRYCRSLLASVWLGTVHVRWRVSAYICALYGFIRRRSHNVLCVSSVCLARGGPPARGPRGPRRARARVAQQYVCVCLSLCVRVCVAIMCVLLDTYLHTPQLQTGHVSNCSPTHTHAGAGTWHTPPGAPPAHATSTTTGISQAESWHRERAEARESASHTHVRVIALVRSASSDTRGQGRARAHATRRVARTGTHALLSRCSGSYFSRALQTLYPPPPPTMAFEMKPMSTWKAMRPKMTC